MDLLTLSSFTITYGVMVLVPGPGVAAIVARALGGGFSSALPMVFGILLGDLAYFFFAVFGLAAIATHFAPVLVLVRWAGAAYLLWIAWQFWTARSGAEQLRPRQDAPWRTFLSGFSLTMGNPKTIVFYLAILPTVVPLGAMTWLALVELTLIVALVLVVISCGYALLAARARALFTSPQAIRRLNRTAGTLMAAAAGLVVLQH